MLVNSGKWWHGLLYYLFFLLFLLLTRRLMVVSFNFFSIYFYCMISFKVFFGFSFSTFFSYFFLSRLVRPLPFLWRNQCMQRSQRSIRPQSLLLPHRLVVVADRHHQPGSRPVVPQPHRQVWTSPSHLLWRQGLAGRPFWGALFVWLFGCSCSFDRTIVALIFGFVNFAVAFEPTVKGRMIFSNFVSFCFLFWCTFWSLVSCCREQPHRLLAALLGRANRPSRPRRAKGRALRRRAAPVPSRRSAPSAGRSRPRASCPPRTMRARNQRLFRPTMKKVYFKNKKRNWQHTTTTFRFHSP